MILYDTQLKAIVMVGVVVIIGIMAGTAYSVYASGGSSITSSSVSTMPSQGCQTYSPYTSPNLFGDQVNTIKQVTLNETYTSSQLQQATDVAMNYSLVQKLTTNRTNVDYTTFQKIASGQVDLTGEFYTVTTATGYVRNGSSLIPLTTGSVLTGYELCGTTLYQEWTPSGILVRILFSPTVQTTNPFQESPTLATIAEVDLTVNTTIWSVTGTQLSPTAAT